MSLADAMPSIERRAFQEVYDQGAAMVGGVRNLPENRRRAQNAAAVERIQHPQRWAMRQSMPFGLGNLTLDTPGALERQTGGMWEALKQDFTTPLDDTKGGWKYPARAGKVGLDALGLVFSPATAGLTGLLGNPVEQATGLNPDVTGNLALMAAPAGPAAVNMAGRARLGGDLGGVRGAVRMAFEPNPITGNAQKWRMPSAGAVPAAQMVIDQPATPRPLPERPQPPLTALPADHPARVPPFRATEPLPDVAPPPGFTLDRPSIAMEGERGASISQDFTLPSAASDNVRPRPLVDPLSDAQRRAMASEVQPGDVLPIMSNEVGGADELAAIERGRYAKATAPNESTALDRGNVRNWRGEPVPKVGPTDLVGWVRLNGGLMDQGGELSHMGLTNAPRRGVDFVGQEHRFGPLVNEAGMSLDDAALRAWEEGYFPELADRPTVNQFLDAVRGTHEGWDRRFLPEDHAQIERFNAMRAERYDLEQQRLETDGPIYNDRSVPAEDAPFPPISAYEEWPAGGPDYAGNINLGKLESPQDIKRALDFTNRQVGFDAAVRGRITNAETERLASELGMTPEKLLSRRKGQAFNAEEALAARQILSKSGNELVNLARKVRAVENPGDEVMAQFRESWLRHVAIQEQVSGMTAEAGRALQQFRMAANSRAVRGDVLTAMVEGAGGKDRLRDAAGAIINAAEESPGRFNALTEQMAKPRFKDKIKELWYNFLLSGPQTHAVNVTSNMLTALGQFPEHAGAAAIGKARQLISRDPIDRVTSTELGQRAYGMTAGLKDGLKQFAKTVRTGETPDPLARVEAHSQDAISGMKGTVIRTPSRFLAAEDELFKAVARRMELHGQAARQAHKEGLKGQAASARIAELVANPTDDLLARTMDYGRYLTFQRPLGPVASKVAAMRNDSLIMTAIIPFVRTPTNILKFAAERSPAAPLLKEWRADFMAGGSRRDLAIAKSVIGSAFGATIYQEALAGNITGAPAMDPIKASFQKANGWQPYSVKIGDKYYSYSRLDPFAMTMGVAADFATRRDGMTDKQANDYAMLITASIISNMGDKTWLSGTADFLQAVHDPQRYGKSYLRRMGASALVPNALAQTARAIDPVERDVQSFGDTLQSRIPFMSDNLPAKRNIWGAEMQSEGGLGPDIVSPIRVSTDKHDPLTEEMLNVGARFAMPSRSVTINGERVKLDPAQYEAYSAQAGQQSRAALEGLMAMPGWSDMTAEQRAKQSKKTVTAIRKGVRSDLLGGGEVPPPPPGFSANGAAPPASPGKGAVPPPPGFKVDGEAGGINVYQDLQQAIPGIGLQSGYRTPEYQADMRRRGYHPAKNSAHLSGSSLDLTPPPGMSMAELRERVRKLYPNAQFINEGDHLHTTFPGYYGAPALGGAKSAGLRNPLEGMPPPPAGFKMD